MPRDIRSYFTAVSSAKPQSNTSTPKPRKRRVISSDEEDEKSQSPLKRSKKVEALEEKKIVSPADVFGKKAIKRQEAPKVKKTLDKKEAEAHDDEEFAETLRQLDTSKIEELYLAECKSNEDSAGKRVDDTPTSPQKEGKKRTPAKAKKNGKDSSAEKKTPDKRNARGSSSEKKDQTRKRKQISSSSNDEEHHAESEEKDKPKVTKKSSKARSSTLEIEIEHKEQKKKESPKKSSDVDVYEERVEKRKQSAALYQQYLQRGGARNPGSKEIPEGAEYCLAGLSFLITGVLDSLEREEVDELIKKYGGRILHQVSKKTDYVIVGDQPGPAKLAKANSLNVKKISEDELLELIRTRPAGSAVDVKESRARSKEASRQKSVEKEVKSSPSPKKVTSHAKEEENPVKPRSPIKKERVTEAKGRLIEKKETTDVKDTKVKTDTSQGNNSNQVNGTNETQALVEKYRPKTMKQILGQQGDKSNAKKLYTWLMNWHKNQSGNVKHTKPSPWAKKDDGAFFKAALLSGPPGIGKTTTVQVVCNELGFDLVEFNASDTRSKKLLKEEVSELLSNTTLKDYFVDNTKKASSKHVLLMDEVDGMAGNEDRGGLQELIALIKTTDIPVICICNDRNNPKMRTLANYTFDLRFPKPRIEQIRGAMKSICYKENINMPTEDLDRLIESTNQDIRQVINYLALYSGKSGHQEKTERRHINKDLKLGPWDVLRKVFSAEEHKHMSIHDKSDLFFHDYNIAPLFVQENYLSAVPQAPKNELLERVAQSAESLALGDMVEKSIRSNGAWSLLPVQACYSSVIPGSVMSGHIGNQINFPSWLGRNSKTNKFDRLMQEITVHARLATGVSKEAINLDYVNHLRDAVVRPLIVDGSDGVDAAMNVMNHYHLLREDLDSLVELSLWPGQRDPMQVIDSKVKAAFTRAYNKHSTALPYVTNTASKKKAAQTLNEEGYVEEEEGDEANSDENDDNVELDKMIKAKKPSTSKNTESKSKSSDKPSKRGRGSRKAK